MGMLKQSITAAIKQGVRSVNCDGYCRYRSGEVKCAIGHLITDEHYTEGLEGKGLFFGNKVHKALNASLGYELSEREVSCLRLIQNAHDHEHFRDTDGFNFVSEFKERIRNYIDNELLPKELRELVIQ